MSSSISLPKTKKIKKIKIKNFTRFKDVELQFSDGINVFLGTNGTGKTHLLKLLYSCTSAHWLYNRLFYTDKLDEELNKYKFVISERLKNVFKVRSLEQLISKLNSVDNYSTVDYIVADKRIKFDLDAKETSKCEEMIKCKEKPENIIDLESIYLPPSEVLSNYSEIISIYETLKIKYLDGTYYDLAKALFLMERKEVNPLYTVFQKIIKETDKPIEKENDVFYTKYSYGKIESTLLAEGTKKLATIDYLIRNGSINNNTIIFWDEPEAHCNPKLITTIVEIIKQFANEGLQFFIATHDYLLSRQISLIDEYRDTIEKDGKKVPDIKFFLLKGEFVDDNEGTTIYEGKNLTDIEYDPILEEFIKHYDEEQELFRKTLPV